MKKIGAIAMIVLGVVLGLYVGIYLMFIGGIIQGVQSITPVVIPSGIAWAVVRIVFAGFIGWISALVLILPGIVLLK